MNRGKFKRIHVAPAYQKVAEAIEHEILMGNFRPGDLLGTEATLVEQFGVNRSTVREGIRLLEQSGLIRRDKGRRLHVSLPRYDRLASRMTRALVLHQTSFSELWEAAMILETSSVEAAAKRITSRDLEELEQNLLRSREAIGDNDRVAVLDSEFHNILARASGNRVLQLAREPASLLFHPTLRIILDHVEIAAQRNLDAHMRIVDALHKDDAESARIWMRKHIEDWRRGFERTGGKLDAPIERAFIEHVGLGSSY